MILKRSSSIILWFGVFFHAAFVVFAAHGIIIGGDCRAIRLVALFTAGLMGILMALLVCWRERENKKLGELFARIRQRTSSAR